MHSIAQGASSVRVDAGQGGGAVGGGSVGYNEKMITKKTRPSSFSDELSRRTRRSGRLTLGRLVVLLALLSVLVTLGNGLYAGYQVIRGLLIDKALESNRVYASKLADIAGLHLSAGQRLLERAAPRLAVHWDEPSRLGDDIRLLQEQGRHFNVITLRDDQGRVRARWPADDGRDAQSRAEVLAALAHPPAGQTPWMTRTHGDADGGFRVVLLAPVRDADGCERGLLTGRIHLHETSGLGLILGQHYYRDGSYIYVVDGEGRILYHVDPARLGDMVASNAVVAALMRGESGAQAVVNTQGVAMLAGYAVIPGTDWGVVAQRPEAAVLADLEAPMLGMAQQVLPLLLLTLLLVGWLGHRLAQPLHQMAQVTQRIDSEDGTRSLVNVDAWYFEARQLKRGLLAGIEAIRMKLNRFHEESHTDPLTALGNRRALDETLQDWATYGIEFSVLALDVDHFKGVNDRYGHDKGDEVLHHLADLMRVNARDDDVLIRAGGEEFLALLPQTGLEGAWHVAERLRIAMAQSPNPTGETITLSIGIAQGRALGHAAHEVLKRADEALYLAKERGRNRTEVAVSVPPIVLETT